MSKNQNAPETGALIADLTDADLANLLLQVRAAEDGFEGFVRLLHPEWEIPKYQLEFIDLLDKLERRQLINKKGEPVHNLLVNMPPRHNKSTLATKLFPAYCIARTPYIKILVSSASKDLAESFGTETRAYLTNPNTKLAYPESGISSKTTAKADWITELGGQYLALGQSGNTIGRPANLLILDDPYPNRQAAESPTQRRAIWSFWNSALWRRREPDKENRQPITIVIHTRWHPSDITGTILDGEDFKEGFWHHVFYEAISKKKRQGRLPEKQALWPERFPLTWLEREERADPREFASQYQQRPYVEGGNLIRGNWWGNYDPDLSQLPPLSQIVIGVDGAFKKTELADYSVALVAGLAQDGDIYILDVMRDRLDFPELKRALIRLNNQWRGRGLRAMYIEDKASGTTALQELKTHSGLSVIPYKVVSDKVSRVSAVTPLIEGGRCLLPTAAPWLENFIKETEQFPNGSHDDQVDALSIVLDVLARTPLHNDSNFAVDPLVAEDSLLKQIQSHRQYTNDPFSNGIDRRSASNSLFTRSDYSSALGE
tara:strand:+ start:4688 stop:6322 length:1635 start_codon:yes stop_codon:yes gene_type:complete